MSYSKDVGGQRYGAGRAQDLTNANTATLFGGTGVNTRVLPNQARDTSGDEQGNSGSGEHKSLADAIKSMGDGTIADDGGTLVTKSKGSIVVAGAGYPGTGPTGASNATPEAGHSWAYATGMVDVRLTNVVVSPDKLAMAIAPGTNEVTYRASRFAAVSFDPCSGPVAVYVNLGS